MRHPASLPAIVAAVALALCTRTAEAAEEKAFAVSPEAAGALKACMVENDDARRLTCYDKALHRASPASHQAKITPPAAEPLQAAEPKTTPEQRFGLSAGQVVKKEKLAESPKELTAKVTSTGRESNGALKLTLDNGQVWVQQSADGQALSISVGDSVTVSHELMGGYLLTTPSGGHRSLRVRRIQ